MTETQQWWCFTFGFGQSHQNCYIKFYGTHEEAWDKMFNLKEIK